MGQRKKNRRMHSPSPAPSNSSTSTPSSTNADGTEDDLQKMNKNLQIANAGLLAKNKTLTETNVKNTAKIATLLKERVQMIKIINKLELELGSRKVRSEEIAKKAKLLHSKYVLLSHDIVEIVVNSCNPACFESSTDASSSKSLHYNAAGLQQQQTQAVKPMVSGHTIQSPVINLPRVSPEQLERLSERVRQGTSEEVTEIAWHGANREDAIEETTYVNVIPEQDVDAEEIESMNLQLSDTEDSPEDSPVETRSQLNLHTILEESEALASSIIINERTRTTTNPMASQILCVSLARPAAVSGSSQNENSSVFETQDTSLADISNLGYVTTRRGCLRRRPNATVAVDTSILTRDTESEMAAPNANAEETDSSTLRETARMSMDMLSSTIFQQGVSESFATSTPALPPSRRKRRKSRAYNENIDETATRANLTRNAKITPCSVVLKRIVALPKRKSISPKKRSTANESTLPSVNSTTSSSSINDTDCSSPRRRPIRRARPTSNLKEVGLRTKMRRV